MKLKEEFIQKVIKQLREAEYTEANAYGYDDVLGELRWVSSVDFTKDMLEVEQ